MNIADKQAKDKINAQLSPNVSLPPPPQGGDGPDDYYDYHYHIGYEELVALYKKAYLEAGFKLKSFPLLDFIHLEVEDKDRSLLYFTFSVPEHKKQHGVFDIVIYSSSPPDQTCDPCEVRRGRHRVLDNDKVPSGQTRAADEQARAQIREQMREADSKARAQIRLALKSMRPPAPAEQGTKPAAQ